MSYVFPVRSLIPLKCLYLTVTVARKSTLFRGVIIFQLIGTRGVVIQWVILAWGDTIIGGVNIQRCIGLKLWLKQVEDSVGSLDFCSIQTNFLVKNNTA